jgi:hypothetical protein
MKQLRKIPVEASVGTVLAHDLTRIVPGEFKGVAFKKGHIIHEKDIPELLKIGKRHLYVLRLSDGHLHEDQAALRIAGAVSGDRIQWTDPYEGKSTMTAESEGILKINTQGLAKINNIDDVIMATLKNNFPCTKGQIVAATRIIPLIISQEKMIRVEKYAQKFFPIICILPYRKMKIGALVTGSEIYEGLIKDEFDMYIGRKVKKYGSDVVQKIIVPDDAGRIAEAIETLRERGVDLIITTGGLSVDPDDVTRLGVQRSKAKIKFYGTPILPGAMFLFAMLDTIPILGLPACIYYHATTVFDLTFPRILAGDPLHKRDFSEMGHGGLCMNCDPCRYPVCPFGK